MHIKVHRRARRLWVCILEQRSQHLMGGKKIVMGFALCDVQSSSALCHIKALEETHIRLSEIASP